MQLAVKMLQDLNFLAKTTPKHKILIKQNVNVYINYSIKSTIKSKYYHPVFFLMLTFEQK